MSCEREYGLLVQPSLFEAPYHHDAGPNEKAAAEKVRKRGPGLRVRIGDWIERQQRYGVTRDEVDLAFDTTPNISQPRLGELVEEGRIYKTDRSRPSRKGCDCTVYVAFEFQERR